MNKFNRFTKLTLAATLAFGAMVPAAATMTPIYAAEPEQVEENDTNEDLNKSFIEEENNEGNDTSNTDEKEDSVKEDEDNKEDEDDKDDELDPSAKEDDKVDTSDWVSPSDKELDKISKEVEKESKKQKDSEKALQDKINEAGKEAGKVVLNLINGKYKDSDETLNGIALSSVKIINSTVIKCIPYVGGFLSTVVDGEMNSEKEDKTVKKLDEISDKLTTINTTIEVCTKRILDQSGNIERNKKIGDMNLAYKTLVDSLKEKAVDFNSAIKTFANDEENKGTRALTTAGTLLDKIYTTDNKTIYKNYMNYCNEIMCTGNQLATYAEFTPDIFAAFKSVVTDGKDGKYAVNEYTNQRNTLVDSVNDTCTQGYEVLSTIIEIDLAKQEALNASYKAAMEELVKAMKSNPDAENYAVLQKAYEDLVDKQGNCEREIAKLTMDQKDLVAMKKKVDEFVKNEVTSINTDTTKFNESKRDDKVTVFYKDYGTETIKGKTVYPSVNGETIEYRDVYGNLMGKRTISNELSKVDQYDVKVGTTYTIAEKGFEKVCYNIGSFGLVNVLEDHIYNTDIEITDVWEKPVMIDLGFWSTQIGSYRWAKGIDKKTGKEFEFNIGATGGGYYVYERVVGNLVEV